MSDLPPPSEPVPSSRSAVFHVSVAARTDVGQAREKNEDAFVVADLSGGTLLDGEPNARFDVGERGVLLAVSDGMGGADSGEVASALVCETLTRAFTNAEPGTPRDALMNDAVQKAHLAVWDEAKSKGRKMGATLTAVFVHAGSAYIAEVGDSRAYLVRRGKITQLTKDQSMVQVLLDTGVIAKADAEHSPLKSIILQAMGNQQNLKVALAKLELRNRDALVLCSDGLTNHVTDEEIKTHVMSMRPQQAATKLVDLANERGGKDNITVVVAGVGGELDPALSTERVTDTFEVLTTFEPKIPSKR